MVVAIGYKHKQKFKVLMKFTTTFIMLNKQY